MLFEATCCACQRLERGWEKKSEPSFSYKIEEQLPLHSWEILRILLLQVGTSRDSLRSLCSWHKIVEVSNQQIVNDDAESYLCHEATQGVCEDPQQLQLNPKSLNPGQCHLFLLLTPPPTVLLLPAVSECLCVNVRGCVWKWRRHNCPANWGCTDREGLPWRRITGPLEYAKQRYSVRETVITTTIAAGC